MNAGELDRIDREVEIGRDSVNHQHHPTQSTTTYRVNSGGGGDIITLF